MLLPDRLFILRDAVPPSAVTGTYDFRLVALSFVVAAVAAYVALAIAAELRGEEGHSERVRMLSGTFSMGGGIWSMHFIGMIAYDTDMAVNYDPFLTAVSLLLAMLFALGAFAVVRRAKRDVLHTLLAAPFLGAGVAAMHYTGMAAMEMDGALYYTPFLFVLSIGIGIGASAAALEIMHFARRKTHLARQSYLAVAAVIMAVAVCGLHYTAMAASVIVPYADCRWDPDASYTDLGMIIALIMGLVLFIAYLSLRLERALGEVELRTKSLVSLQHNEMVAQIVGGFAHEFNNTLGAIVANAEGAMDAVRPDQRDLKDKLGRVLSRARSASGLTESLLGFSQQKNLVPSVRDINEDLSAMEGVLQHSLKGDITLVMKLTPDICRVQVDPGEFRNAVMNLVVNARDALDKAGVITVQTERLYMAGDMLRCPLPSGAYVAISVVDDGPGIPADIRNHIIEPFFTTKDVVEGSGLGLSVVHGFATQSGGALDFYSEPGKGATFTIYLPALDQGGAEEEKSGHAPVAAPLGDETILVVEDDDDIRRYITRISRELGYTVFKAATVQAAKGLIRKGLEVDLILCDAHLGNGQSGIEFVHFAHENAPGARVVIMSGMSGLTSAERKQFREEYLYIQKPFSRERLGATIRAALDGGENND